MSDLEASKEETQTSIKS